MKEGTCPERGGRGRGPVPGPAAGLGPPRRGRLRRPVHGARVATGCGGGDMHGPAEIRDSLRRIFRPPPHGLVRGSGALGPPAEPGRGPAPGGRRH